MFEWRGARCLKNLLDIHAFQVWQDLFTISDLKSSEWSFKHLPCQTSRLSTIETSRGDGETMKWESMIPPSSSLDDSVCALGLGPRDRRPLRTFSEFLSARTIATYVCSSVEVRGASGRADSSVPLQQDAGYGDVEPAELPRPEPNCSELTAYEPPRNCMIVWSPTEIPRLPFRAIVAIAKWPATTRDLIGQRVALGRKMARPVSCGDDPCSRWRSDPARSHRSVTPSVPVFFTRILSPSFKSEIDSMREQGRILKSAWPWARVYETVHELIFKCYSVIEYTRASDGRIANAGLAIEIQKMAYALCHMVQPPTRYYYKDRQSYRSLFFLFEVCDC